MNFTQEIFEIAKESPDEPLFLAPSQMSNSEFCTRVDSNAQYFRYLGIVSASKCIVLSPPGNDMFAVVIALFRIGIVPVLIDPGMGIKAMVCCLKKANADVVIGSPKAGLLKWVYRSSFKTVKYWISVGFRFPGIPYSINKTDFQKKSIYPVYQYEDKDLVAVFFTSGSTGPAKGVEYTYAQLNAQKNILKKDFGYQKGEIDFCTFPLVGFYSICIGMSIVISKMNTTKPNKTKAQELVQGIYESHATHMFCSPMILKKVTDYCLKHNIHLSTLKRVIIAGAPIRPNLLQKFCTLLVKDAIVNTPYGATEALPITQVNQHELKEAYVDNKIYNGVCVGKALSSVKVKIIGISDDPISNWSGELEVHEEEIGEIIVQGENVTQNYLSNTKANIHAKIRDATTGLWWHRMGDLGWKDKQNRIWLVGRKAHRVVTKSETLYTLPCEAVFNQHPLVEKSALIGMKDEAFEKPVICIELKDYKKKGRKLKNELLTLSAQYDHCKNIRLLLFHRQLPVDPRHNAKIFREKLVEWAEKRRKRIFW